VALSRKFSRPIVLKDSAQLASLSDAAELILNLPERGNPHWTHAAEMLLKASKDAATVGSARDHLARALEAEGLI
jgi:hypothetical protein